MSAVQELARLVDGFIASDEIVGAELLVIHDRKTILHRAFGFSDREANQPMQCGQYFAVRSMTKPFTGMAAQILIDAGKLELDAPVAKYLPSFNNDRSSAITLRHLLTHKAGFPVVGEPGKPLSDYAGGLRELADRAGERGPETQPGVHYLYSDVGSDVLGAVIAAVSGQSLENFIRERILVPLQLNDTFPEAQAVTPERRGRVPARYLGVAGHWTRYWSGMNPPIYPFLKGSGGLFSTTQDYARFLQAWIDREQGEARGVLSAGAFARALAQDSRDTMSTGFPEATTDYGQMWMLYRARNLPATLFAFGHGGSDGTHAYAFPGHNLIVCYFTQTRGNSTSARFEEALSHLFLRPNPEAMAKLVQPAVPGNLEEFIGLYAKNNQIESLGAIVELGGALVFEFPGRMLLRLRATENRDRWVPERAPNDAIVFRRTEGRVIGLALHRGNRVDEAERFRPDATLPSVEEIISLRARSTSSEAFDALLPLRVTAEWKTKAGTLPVTSVYGTDGRSVTEVEMGSAGKLCIWTAGDRVWQRTPESTTAVELKGPERLERLENSLIAQMSDWPHHYRDVTVLAKETFDGREVFRVRLTRQRGMAVTKLVNAETGVVVAEFGITMMSGNGSQGAETRYRDIREVGGREIGL